MLMLPFREVIHQISFGSFALRAAVDGTYSTNKPLAAVGRLFPTSGALSCKFFGKSSINSINLSCLRQMFRSGPLKGGLQEKMYFLLGCVRCASGKYDLIDRECDFQRKLFKNQILHDIFMENSKRYEK